MRQKLKDVRLHLGLTLQNVADASNMTRQNYQYIESGSTVNVSLSAASKIKVYLKEQVVEQVESKRNEIKRLQDQITELLELQIDDNMFEQQEPTDANSTTT